MSDQLDLLLPTIDESTQLPTREADTVPARPLTQRASPVIARSGVLSPLSVQQIELRGGFWGERQALNSSAIIPHALGWVERLGWLQNLEDAGAKRRYEHRGRQFADSEIYKLIEAISWDAARGERTQLDTNLDRLIEAIGSAQDPDGYLHTLFGRPWQQPRYSDFKWGHELYCFGHLIQAAVGHYRSTGDERLLGIARKLGDHVCTMFGPDGIVMVCGHAEIELGLVELYRATGERSYLDQAAVFVERRGTGTLPPFEFGAAFWQDDMPVRAATVLRGHAVRALYLAAGAVDVAVETGDDELLEALRVQWDTTVARRTYITGGMGSHHMDEAFGEDFVLPPDRSYCETCAGVASIMFSWRLLLATGESKYADLIERTLHNVVATSPSADGRSFFYANTLHQREEHALPALNEDGVVIRGGAAGRQVWYEVSCCPPNVARTLASLGAYIATGDATGAQIHQYASGRIRLDGGPGVEATIDITTEYPANGIISMRIVEGPEDGLSLSLRVPQWANGAVLRRAGSSIEVEPGYVRLDGLTSGDDIVLELPMNVRAVYPDDRIDAIRGCVAVERGPEVFAIESVDLPTGWQLTDVAVEPDSFEWADGAISVHVRHRRSRADGAWPFGALADHMAGYERDGRRVKLIPYQSWAERGPSTMRIWIPVSDGR